MIAPWSEVLEFFVLFHQYFTLPPLSLVCTPSQVPHLGNPPLLISGCATVTISSSLHPIIQPFFHLIIPVIHHRGAAKSQLPLMSGASSFTAPKLKIIRHRVEQMARWRDKYNDGGRRAATRAIATHRMPAVAGPVNVTWTAGRRGEVTAGPGQEGRGHSGRS